ncbi:MAG: 2-oxoacid:acceptor oxidoreductase family protein [Candidatus Heimdallarchaeota archaeon]|nr:2-oxoacid:acceptor oxidoreductase family protein [Candidatus Heimdallarchaeota archaeon]MCK4955378.1 2-oxoacid:acceptor oxidoreductase family protein [Candidatus Heimdallarchaeota archaeon]
MIEVIQISRGGSGGVTGAKILAEAAMYEGLDSQAIPKYGSERRGATVLAYVRFDTKPIRIHSPVYNSNHALILDLDLLDEIDVDTVDKEGVIIINAKEVPDQLKGTRRKVAYVDATGISQDMGLVISGFTLVNMTMLGAFVKGTNIVSLDNLVKAIKNFWGERRAPKNVEAAIRAYEETEVVVA